MPEEKIKSKEKQKVSDNNNYYWGYFIQTIETKANKYISYRYKSIFETFCTDMDNKLNHERSSQGRGIKVGDIAKAEKLICDIYKKFQEFSEILKPSIVESLLNDIAKEKVKDDRET